MPELLSDGHKRERERRLTVRVGLNLARVLSLQLYASYLLRSAL